MRLSSLFRLAATGLVAAGLAGAATAQTTIPAEQRAAFEGVIRDYLLKNPEILQEALGELERRQNEAQKTAQLTALRDTGPTLLRSPHGNVVGNAAGDVTLVEFFDYNCGYCKRALGDLKALVKADPNLRVVLRDFPVLGPDSVEAAKVALAAKQQLSGERLFDYHAKVLETRGRVGGDRALAVAREMGLDMARLQRDMGGPAVTAALQENAMLGDKLALTGTPAYVIGEEIVSGAVGAEPLKQAIASVRRCGKAAC